ncbi:MAG: hypothetical protein HRU70_07585 [Phycisphaeraceae bacterium]|nr:MAG: hypothetical protein HRU70_07585 [Phycisphaeraceae bacterium]
MARARFTALFAPVLAAVCAVPAPAQTTTPRPARPGQPQPSAVQVKVDEIMARAFEAGDAAAPRIELERMIDRSAYADALATPAELADLWAICSARRFLILVSRVGQFDLPGQQRTDTADPAERLARDEADRRAFVSALKDFPRLRASVARIFDPAIDDARGVLRVASAIATSKPKEAERFSELAAAIAVVHDRPIKAWDGREVDAAALFDHFTRYHDALVFGADRLPAEMMVFMADVRSTPEEWRWAVAQYRGRIKIGKSFFDVPYDTEHLERSVPKKIEGKPYTFHNLRVLGGICVDQVYFAAQVAKAIGVPSVVQSAPGRDLGHAWVGYFHRHGDAGRWDLTEGRYEEFKGQRGSTVDPQTGRGIADGQLNLRAGYALLARERREAAVALYDAALRLDHWSRQNMPLAKACNAPPDLAGIREADAATVLTLLEASVTQAPSYEPAWAQVHRMVSASALDEAQVKRWTDAMSRLCGPELGDFAVEWAAPMIDRIGTPRQQVDLWEWMYTRYVTGIKDRRLVNYQVAADIRLRQADLWAKAGEPGKAWETVQRVIREFREEGHALLQATQRGDSLLREGGRPIGERVELWKDSFLKAPRPSNVRPEFAMSSSWFQLGTGYVAVLREAGRGGEAQPIADQLQAVSRRRN